MNKKTIFGILGFIALASLIAFVTAQILATLVVPNHVEIAQGNLMLKDESGTVQVSSINWGFVNYGEPISKNFRIENLGNVPLTVSMSTNLPVSSGSIGWDYAIDPVVDAGSSIPVTFTLTINLQLDTVFDFNLVLTGTR